MSTLVTYLPVGVTAFSGVIAGYFAAHRQQKAENLTQDQGRIEHLFDGYQEMIQNLVSEMARLRTVYAQEVLDHANDVAELKKQVNTHRTKEQTHAQDVLKVERGQLADLEELKKDHH